MKKKTPFYRKWWYYVLSGLILVSGISLLVTDLGSGVFGTLLGAGMLALPIVTAKRKKTSRNANNLPFSFEAAGVYYHESDLISVASTHSGFNLPDDQFLAKYSDGKNVYQYYFNNTVGTLVPEPDNPRDKKAIAVKLNDVCVGYVPADLTGTVSKLMKKNPLIKVNARGGPYKYIMNGEVYKEPKEFRVFVDMKKRT